MASAEIPSFPGDSSYRRPYILREASKHMHGNWCKLMVIYLFIYLFGWCFARYSTEYYLIEGDQRFGWIKHCTVREKPTKSSRGINYNKIRRAE